MTKTQLYNELKNDIIKHLRLREGVRHKVYKDSLGKLTVGVGHLVLPKDNLKLGDAISDERVNSLLEQDMTFAFNGAVSQANTLTWLKDEPEAYKKMVEALTHVNFQLGVLWTSIHRQSWHLILLGRLTSASEEIKDSRWYVQTPKRVNDFAASLLKINRMMNESSKDDDRTNRPTV